MVVSLPPIHSFSVLKSAPGSKTPQCILHSSQDPAIIVCSRRNIKQSSRLPRNCSRRGNRLKKPSRDIVHLCPGSPPTLPLASFIPCSWTCSEFIPGIHIFHISILSLALSLSLPCFIRSLYLIHSMYSTHSLLHPLQ